MYSSQLGVHRGDVAEMVVNRAYPATPIAGSSLAISASAGIISTTSASGLRAMPLLLQHQVKTISAHIATWTACARY